MFTTSAVIRAIDDRPGGIRVLTLAPDRPFAYRAGQYAEISAGGFDSRPYSIASAPRDSGDIVIHVRNLGGSLSTHLVTEARVGDVVAIDGPYGGMDAERARERPVLMVAGGTGIAPVIALAQDILRRGLTDEDITIVYGVRGADDYYCRPELDALLSTGQVALHLVSGPQTPDAELKKLAPNLAHHIVFVSGPDPMMLSVHPVLLALLADPERIFTDADMTNLTRPAP